MKPTKPDDLFGPDLPKPTKIVDLFGTPEINVPQEQNKAEVKLFEAEVN